MAEATLTSKGQLTIPKEIRELLHLRTGDHVSFRRAANGQVIMEPAPKVDIVALAGRFKSMGTTLDDVDLAIRAGWESRGRRP